jgi:hypothetical protein
VINAHKNDLSVMTVRQLRARRRALAARLGDVELVLSGSLAEQSRRCGKPGCRCADGDPHGPYAYFTPRPAGRHDGRADLLAEQFPPGPRTGARHDTRLILIAPVRRSAPPRALIQIHERHHVITDRIQLDHVVSQRLWPDSSSDSSHRHCHRLATSTARSTNNRPPRGSTTACSDRS